MDLGQSIFTNLHVRVSMNYAICLKGDFYRILIVKQRINNELSYILVHNQAKPPKS